VDHRSRRLITLGVLAACVVGIVIAAFVR